MIYGSPWNLPPEMSTSLAICKNHSGMTRLACSFSNASLKVAEDCAVALNCARNGTELDLDEDSTLTLRES